MKFRFITVIVCGLESALEQNRLRSLHDNILSCLAQELEITTARILIDIPTSRVSSSYFALVDGSCGKGHKIDNGERKRISSLMESIMKTYLPQEKSKVCLVGEFNLLSRLE